MKFFILFMVLLTFCSFHRFKSIEGQYQSSRHIDPYSFVYYKLRFANVHFPASDLLLNKDSTYSFKTCPSIIYGKYYVKNDSIFLTSDTKNSELMPLVFLVKRSHLVSIVKNESFTNVWTLDKAK